MPKTVVVVFGLEEDVTPDLFVEKIGLACARGGALRTGESIRAANSVIKFEVDATWAPQEPQSLRLIGGHDDQ